MGAKHSRLRQIYSNMKYRCYAPNLDERTAKAYRDKGIRVCEEWLGYYGNFESWALSHGYKDGLSLDRIDPNGNYCPENCRWVSISENRARREAFYGYAPETAVAMTDAKQAQAQKLLDMCKKLEPTQLRILLTYGEGILAAMDHFGICSVDESRPEER